VHLKKLETYDNPRLFFRFQNYRRDMRITEVKVTTVILPENCPLEFDATTEAQLIPQGLMTTTLKQLVRWCMYRKTIHAEHFSFTPTESIRIKFGLAMQGNGISYDELTTKILQQEKVQQQELLRRKMLQPLVDVALIEIQKAENQK
jgi:hypothetical protein